VVNPGSAGQARDHVNGKRLSYAVLELGGGAVTVDDVTIDNYLVDEHRAARGACCAVGSSTS
jgi:hypothetical protein